MTDSIPAPSQTPAELDALWKRIVVRYQEPSQPRAIWQLLNTLGPLALLGWALHASLAVSWWLTFPLAALAGAFLVRVFIIFHDCGHGSYFKSRRANDAVGFLTGLLTFTPYYQWRWDHAIHHATAGHLDKRGTGDIWTMTVQEYLEASRGRRFAYRLARNPLILFVIAPLFVLVIKQRFPSPGANRKARWSVYRMNVALVAMAAGLSLLFGLKAYLLIQLTMLAVAGSAGFWLFYVQHQFEGAYWEREEQWDFTAAALQGSSYYRLPRVLQWFSGNIGYHHIHHLSARIPNYNLEPCHRSHPIFQNVPPLTLLASLKTLRLRFWDEKERRLVGYAHLRRLQQQQTPAPPEIPPRQLPDQQPFSVLSPRRAC